MASKPLGADAGRLIASTEGVREAQPWMQNNVRLEGRDAQAWGLPARPLMNTRVDGGRWYTDAEVGARAKVAVLGATIAKTTGKRRRRPHPARAPAAGPRRCASSASPATRPTTATSSSRPSTHAAVGARLARRGQQLLDHDDHEGPRR